MPSKKKQNSFIIFKNNITEQIKNRESLFTVTNCFFRLKNLVKEELPLLEAESEIEKDFDFLRMKEIQEKIKVDTISKEIKDIEKELEKSKEKSQDQNKIDKWVELLICESLIKFKKEMKESEKQDKKFFSRMKENNFRNKFRNKDTIKKETLSKFTLNIDNFANKNEKQFSELRDVKAHLLIFFRLLAIKFRLDNPILSSNKKGLSPDIEDILEIKTVSFGLKALILIDRENLQLRKKQRAQKTK